MGQSFRDGSLTHTTYHPLQLSFKLAINPIDKPSSFTMSLLRSSLSSTFLRPFLRAAPRATLPITSQRFAGDYGGGEGDPVGENPQDQGPSKSSDLEHPGPPPPKVGQGTGTTPTKATSEGHNTGGTSSSGESSSSSASSQQSSGGGNGGDKTKGAQPKILDTSPPDASEQSQDVKQHNKEMENRAEKAPEKTDDPNASDDQKVDKGFWAGECLVTPSSTPSVVAFCSVANSSASSGHGGVGETNEGPEKQN